MELSLRIYTKKLQNNQKPINKNGLGFCWCSFNCTRKTALEKAFKVMNYK